MFYENKRDEHNQPYVEVALSDYALINTPLLNKGMAFDERERKEFGLYGLLPPTYASLEVQRERSYEALMGKSTDIEKYIYLRDLQDSNETLFYSLLTQHLSELLPIIYTPVVGEGCQRFSETYRRPRGLFIAYPYKDRIMELLSNPKFDAVEVIVVSDGERILGLGDQGAGGMGIPIGKLSLYTACAGIHPASTLPILLDTGTDNLERLNNPLYIGWKHERIRGEAYDEFIDLFVTAVNKRFPKVLLQWEDFAQNNANPILARYRDKLCTFNDDIQGAAAITTGTLLSAIGVTGIPLSEQRIVVLGAGSAGCGICHLIMQTMMDAGLTESQAKSKFFLVDRSGLLLEDTPGLMPFQLPFCKPKALVADWGHSGTIDLMEVVKAVHPTVLIGACSQPGAFTEALVREMNAHVERPIIFPLSNPPSRSEAIPVDLMRWSNGSAIISTGSPFPDIIRHGVSMRVDQTNNAYIFPGMGLGLIAVKSSRVTDKMFMVAAKALADASPSRLDKNANLLPSIDDIREVSREVALAVAKEAVASGYAAFKTPVEIETAIDQNIWEPHYLPFRVKTP